tara:strand:- start:6405 stop:6602 length:198 start_codon:yes stop_codon:yes gene_type:complete
MSTNKFVKKKDLGEGTRFHELVTKVTVEFYAKCIDDGEYCFQRIMPWIKGNRYLKVIQKKLRSKS